MTDPTVDAEVRTAAINIIAKALYGTYMEATADQWPIWEHVGALGRSGFEDEAHYIVELLHQAGAVAGGSVADVYTEISRTLDATRPNGVTDSEQLWRRVTKVCEESGEVWSALSGYLNENPRKGQTHTREDVVLELLDVASAALCAVQHLSGNGPMDVSALLRSHAERTLNRLRTALANEGGDAEHHPNCFQNTRIPDDLPDNVCDCKVLRMIDKHQAGAAEGGDERG